VEHKIQNLRISTFSYDTCYIHIDTFRNDNKQLESHRSGQKVLCKQKILSKFFSLVVYTTSQQNLTAMAEWLKISMNSLLPY